MDRKMVENMLGIERPAYAWRADKWLMADGIQIEPPDTVIEGPGNAPDELLVRLAKGEGERFRCLDGDDYPYFEGRIIVVDPDAQDGEAGDMHFGPLWDLGEGGYGCTTIQYWKPGKGGGWETL